MRVRTTRITAIGSLDAVSGISLLLKLEGEKLVRMSSGKGEFGEVVAREFV